MNYKELLIGLNTIVMIFTFIFMLPITAINIHEQAYNTPSLGISLFSLLSYFVLSFALADYDLNNY